MKNADRKTISILAIITLALLITPTVISADYTVSELTEDEVVPSEVIVGFKMTEELAYLEALISSHEGSIIDKDDTLNAVLVKVTGDTSLFINELQKEEAVRYAEPNRIVKGLMVPNDLLFQYQWGPNRVDALNKWDTETGNKSVIVAIVDTGIDYNHADLTDNYINTGYDFVNTDNDPWDDNGHGTHCAGIVAAEINNNNGIAGTAQISLMAVKVLDFRGYGTLWSVSQGIKHAADNDANIISLSLGGQVGSSVLSDAVNYAHGEGCLLVAAAGNNYGGPVIYPAKYENVIAVSAIDGFDNLASFSNKGPEIELTAPGVCILSTWPGGGYKALRGTSMAAPHVSGVAALNLSQNMSLSNNEIRTILQTTAHDIGAAGWDEEFGFGVVDANTDGTNSPNDWTAKYNAAVVEYCKKALPDLIVEDITWQPADICSGDTVTFTAKVTNKGNGAVTDPFDVRFWVDGNKLIPDKRVTNIPIQPGDSRLVTHTWTADKPCDHTIRVFADWKPEIEEWIEDNNDRGEKIKVATPTVESSDAGGNKKDRFLVGDKVYAYGSCYEPGKTYNLSIVEDRVWNDGMAIPPFILQTTVSTDANGKIIPHPTLIWPSAVIGKYDIVVDVNGNEEYDECVDALDDMDVEDAGFEVVPEFTTIAIPVAAVMGLLFLFSRRKRKV